jgi:sugar lactone lactonase YvrE
MPCIEAIPKQLTGELMNHKPDSIPRVFAEGLDHPECVAVHPDGSVWCGGEAGQIYRIAPTRQKVEQLASTGGFVLGIAFSPDLEWLAICDIRRKALLRLDLTSWAISTYAETIAGWRLNIPNYPVFSRAGELYFSESGEFGKTQGRIFRIDAGGRAELWAGGDLAFANGLALDNQERHLYVVESFLPGVCRYPILPDGSAGPRELYVENLREVPDGLAFDRAGNLYCSCYAPSRIYRIDPDRKATVFAEDPTCHDLSNCTNIAFGGPGFNTLFAANLGRWHITAIDTDAQGAPLACHAGVAGIS